MPSALGVLVALAQLLACASLSSFAARNTTAHWDDAEEDLSLVPDSLWPGDSEAVLPEGLMEGRHSHSSPFDARINGAVPPTRASVRSKASQRLPKAAAGLFRSTQLQRLRWLHIPKTGTSFIATIWNYACGQRGLPLDLYLDDYYTPGCGKCYDFAIMDRYPKLAYCEPGVLSSHFATQHRPTTAQELSGESVVGFFRRPSQRLMSAHRNGMHASGFGREEYLQLRQTCNKKTASCFARYPGIAGCATRMLVGLPCADGSATLLGLGVWDRGLSHVSTAVQNLVSMRFIGLTEEWDESVCLFHRMFGGRTNPAEFKDFHPHPGKSQDYDEEELEGFVDEADEWVYTAAKARYEQLKAKYVPEGESVCGGIFGPADPEPGDAASGLALPSCGAAGQQCGELEGKVDCGRCPRHRTLLRPEWAGALPTCSGGLCSVDGEEAPDVFAWYLPSET